ncbi:MAG TPA: NDP-hexose 2,3-dehydratase family protein [Pilimelia sp.]|nr:NDP-hexose 2,3-dehydratase family protein [Pilimelia sp.]
MKTHDETTMSLRLVHSAFSREQALTDLDSFRRELAAAAAHTYTLTERVPLHNLTEWRMDRRDGVIRHRSGKFFTVQGIDVDVAGAAIPHWDQPIINQPEVGILGILMKEFDGVLHCLMQFKAEPGNCNGIQVSPTVQATRSNYTRVHGGSAVPYLDYFLDRSRHRVVLDSRQSEQGSWFLRKLNRNMIIEVSEPVEVVEGFHWLTLAQLNELLFTDDVINMDARSVLSCLPFTDVVLDQHGSAHTMVDLLSWITERRSTVDVTVRQRPLHRLSQWRYNGAEFSHVNSRFFDVIGVRVEARGREVGQWDQPMLAARGTGLVAFLTTRLDGVPHVLVQARVEPGFADFVQLAPTVQCIPDNYRDAPRADWPPFLADVLDADRRTVRYDAVQSEEGGRFHHIRSRHLLVEADAVPEHPDFRWMTPHQLTRLLWHSNYVNIQARSLLACLRAVTSVGPVANPRPAAAAPLGRAA